MATQDLLNFLTESPVGEIAKRLKTELDASSPHVGAKGPPDRSGPENPYKAALKQAEEKTRKKTGEAVNKLLLQEARNNLKTPLLVFNLARLLEAVPMPEARPALAALNEMQNILQEALKDKDEDLYRRFLRAFAINMPPKEYQGFWEKALTHANVNYVKIAVAALRLSGWEGACEALPLIKREYENRRIGDIGKVVKNIVMTYPDARWPDCARDTRAFNDDKLRALIEFNSRSVSYDRPLIDITPTPDAVYADLKSKVGQDQLPNFDNRANAASALVA